MDILWGKIMEFALEISQNRPQIDSLSRLELHEKKELNWKENSKKGYNRYSHAQVYSIRYYLPSSSVTKTQKEKVNP